MTKSPTFAELDGKVAIVTGGTDGIGAAIARELGAAGARVVVGSRREEATKTMAESLRAAGVSALGIPFNVLEPDSVGELVSSVVEEYGGIDVLVNNVGASFSDRFRKGPLLDLEAADLIEAFRLNTAGTFVCSKAAVPHLRPRGGCIVNVASYVAFQAQPTMGAYGASKAALVHLTRTMAAEWAPEIRVNVVAPGHIDTPRVRTQRTPERAARALADVALQRLGSGEDVAQAVRYAVSPAAAWMTGAVLNIDGGQRLL